MKRSPSPAAAGWPRPGTQAVATDSWPGADQGGELASLNLFHKRPNAFGIRAVAMEVAVHYSAGAAGGPTVSAAAARIAVTML